jgi:PAS domain S-box-containing protein
MVADNRHTDGEKTRAAAEPERVASTSLSRANEKLSVIFEHSPYLILTYGRGGIITYINRVGPGFTMDDVIGTDSHHFVKPEFHARYDEMLGLLFDEGQASKFEFLDVNETWWEATLVPVVHDGQVEQGISFSVDITSKRRAEQEQVRLREQMLHAQKLESLGVLAGGIAHDFNNLLLVISANTDLALSTVPVGSKAREPLEDALRAATAAADLCKQMLAYAGRGHLVAERIDLSRLVSDMTKLVAISVSKGVRLKRDLASNLPVIEADPTQLRQVILNLITNASDAIGTQQGTLSVSTRLAYFDESALARASLSQELAPGEYAVLEVQDTGHGVDAATRARMFEPFFSTRANGRGLGLSATLGIVHHHRGALAVESTVGVGTLIRVILPTVDGVAAHAAQPVAPSPEPGRGLILVIDDEPGVRKATSAVLTHHGL